MLIQRIIVQDIAGNHVLVNPLEPRATEEEVRDAFAKASLPILSLTIDTVGVALVTVAKRRAG